MPKQKSRGPVADFCTGLRRLQERRGLDRSALARRLGYSRSQLYAILDGRVSRPPEWDRLVEPLVRACTGNDEVAVAVWRQRHEVLLEVYNALKHQRRQDGTLTARPRWCRHSCRRTWMSSPAGRRNWPNSIAS